MEDIKLLKENFVFVKEGIEAPSRFYRKIAAKLSERLDNAESVTAAANLLPDEHRAQFLENFTDT